MLRSCRHCNGPKSTGDSEENHHFIWHLGPSCVAKRSREQSKSEWGVCLTPILERNTPWSRRTLSLRSLRQRNRPKSTGDSEENHHFVCHLGFSCVAKRSREHSKSKWGVCLTPILERNAPWSRRTTNLRSCRQRNRPKSTGDSVERSSLYLAPRSLLRCQTITRTLQKQVGRLPYAHT